MNTTANQSTAANRRPDGQSDGSGDFVSDCCRRSSVSVVVAELGCHAAKV
ncbi:MAG: hypothetical protein RL022_2280 [Chloroflexota bacterium]